MKFYCIGGGFWKPVSLVQCNTSPSHRVDQVVDCGLWHVVHSSSMAVWSCWILAGTGTRCRIRRSRASQTCSMGDMSGEYAGHAINWDVFSFQELCTDPGNMGLWIIMLQHEVMVMDEWHNNGPQELITVSLCIQNAINKMHLCTITPPPPWATRSTTLTSANRSPTQRHTRCLPSALYSENWYSSEKRTPLQSARRHRMWALAHSSRLRRQTAVRWRPRWGRQAYRWASLRRFLTVCAEILWLWKPIVAAAVRVAVSDTGCGGPGLVWLHVVCGCEAGWMYWMYSETPVETAYGWEMNIQFTASALVDIPPSPSKLATSVALCCVIKPHFRVAFYCGQPKAHLCNNHAV